jgi:DNA replication protein DnaC
MSELVSGRIREHAERLRLTHLAENAEQLIARAEEAQMGYRELLDLALEEELGVREGRRFRNALKLSGLPHHEGLDEFDFAFQPQRDARKVRDLATLAQWAAILGRPRSTAASPRWNCLRAMRPSRGRRASPRPVAATQELRVFGFDPQS